MGGEALDFILSSDGSLPWWSGKVNGTDVGDSENNEIWNDKKLQLEKKMTQCLGAESQSNKNVLYKTTTLIFKFLFILNIF